MQVLKELWTEKETPEVSNTYQYVLELRNRLEETCKIARDSLYDAKSVYKHHYDKSTRHIGLKKGDKVLLLLPTSHNKLMLQWKGPYKVVEVVNRMDYKVKVDDRVGTYHINLLKRFEERDDTVFSGMAIIEAEPSSEISVVDDESLLNSVCMKGEETYKVVQISENLTAEQKADVTRLLEEFQCIFTDVPGTTHLAEHKIQLTTKGLIPVRPYPIPYAKRQEVEKNVQAMLEADVIEPAMSDYNSPIVLVKKKDGTNRFCVDFRRINFVTKFDTEPLGNPEDIMSKLKDDKFFSKIDLSKGLWQIMVEKSSQHLTAFSTTDGSYTFKVLRALLSQGML